MCSLIFNLAAPTVGEVFFPLAAAADVGQVNSTDGLLTIDSCQSSEQFVRSLVRGKIVICTYTLDFDSEASSIATVADNMSKVGAAGFILTMNPDIGFELIKGASVTLQVPGVILNNMEASSVLHLTFVHNTEVYSLYFYEKCFVSYSSIRQLTSVNDNTTYIKA